MRVLGRILFLLSVALLPVISQAADTPALKETVAGTPAEYVVKTVISLGLVIAAIFFVAWMAKKINRFSGVESGQIKIIGSLAIGAKEKILLVEVGTTQILIGATPNQITHLLQLEEHVKPERSQGATPNFNGFLNGILHRHKSNA